MSKPFAFSRKGWLALSCAGLILALGITVWLLWFSGQNVPGEAPGVEETIAEYGQSMAKNPSAKIAGEMLDFAMESGKEKLVFTVLKEHILPWTEVEDVLAEFVRGSRWYFQHSTSADIVFWLEEEVRTLSPGTDLNEDLAIFYLRRGAGTQTVEFGHKLLANWTLNGAARAHYLKSLKTLWANAPLPIQRGNEYQGIELVQQFPLHRADLEEFRDIPQYIELWTTCFRGSLDVEFIALMEQTSPESDPLDLYWSIWTVALLRDLEPGWHNPLCLDVADKIAGTFSHLSKNQLIQVYQTLNAQRDPASRSQSAVLLELLSHHSLAKDYDYEAVVLFLNSAGLDQSLLRKPVYTAQDMVEFSPEVQALYNELSKELKSFHYFQTLDTLLNTQIPDSDLKLQKSMSFYIPHEILFSNSEPAALVMTDEGHTLVDIINLTETSFPGYWGSWSLKGDKFALVKSEDGRIVIRIMSAKGQELKRYTLSLDMPILHNQGDRVFVPMVYWYSPWELTIAYRCLGLYYDEYPDTRRYLYNLNTQELAEVSPEDTWYGYSYLAGADLYYGPELIDNDGNKVGEILKVSDNCAKVPSRDVQLCLKGQELVLETGQETASLLNNVSSLSWAAWTDQGEILANIYLELSNDGSAGPRSIAVDVNTGAVRSLSQGKMWYDDAEYTIQGSDRQILVSSEYFQHDKGWLLLGLDEPDNGFGDNVTVDVGETALPVTLRWHAYRIYKTGESYILVASDIRIYYILDVTCWVLVFK